MATRRAKYSWEKVDISQIQEHYSISTEAYERKVRITSIVGLVLVGALVVFLGVQGIGSGSASWFIVAGLVALVGGVLASPKGVRARLSKKEASDAMLAVKVWGEAGDGLKGASPKLGKENVAAGVAGERRTATALEPLLQIPGVRIFHGLKYNPTGGGDTDVDHIVVCGNRMALIDSKNYRAPVIMWTPDGRLGRFDSAGKPMLNPGEREFKRPMIAAVENYVNLFRGVDTRGYVVVHGSANQRLDSRDLGRLRMRNAHQAVEELGQWFLAGKPGYVNRRLIAGLVKARK